MAIILRRKEFTLPPAGLHHARIIRIIDLGTQIDTFQGTVKNNPKIMILFEYMHKKRADGTNEVISQDYTAVFGEKSNFQKAFQTLDEDLFKKKEVDVATILGQACAITVIRKTSRNGKERAEVSSVSPPMEGMPLLEAVSTPKLFDLSEPDWDLFNEFGDWIKDKIRKSPEYAALDLPANAPPPLAAETPKTAKMPLNDNLIKTLEGSLKTGAMTLEKLFESYEVTEEQRLHFESLDFDSKIGF